MILELIVGLPNVFLISAYTPTLLYQNLEGWSEYVPQVYIHYQTLFNFILLLCDSSWYDVFTNNLDLNTSSDVFSCIIKLIVNSFQKMNCN